MLLKRLILINSKCHEKRHENKLFLCTVLVATELQYRDFGKLYTVIASNVSHRYCMQQNISHMTKSFQSHDQEFPVT